MNNHIDLRLLFGQHCKLKFKNLEVSLNYHEVLYVPQNNKKN